MKSTTILLILIFLSLGVSAEDLSPERERELLASLSSPDVLEVSQALRQVHDQLIISSPAILSAVSALMHDERPQWRSGGDVIISVRFYAYRAMERIIGFEPSQPSMDIDERLREIEILMAQKHPEIAEFEKSKKVEDSGSVLTKMPNGKSGSIDVANESGPSKKVPDPSDEGGNEDSIGEQDLHSWIIIGIALLGGFVLLFRFLKVRKNQ